MCKRAVPSTAGDPVTAPVRSQAWRSFVVCAGGACVSLAGCKDVFNGLTDDWSITPRGPNMVIGAPQLWGGTSNESFEIGNDYGVKHDGRASAFIRTLVPKLLSNQFGTLTQAIRADAFLGRRVKLSGWLRTTGPIGDDGAGLWLRVDGASSTVFDNMDNRRIMAATEWREVSIVAHVPDDAIGVVYGVVFKSPGIVWVDDLKLEFVDDNVPLTAMTTPTVADTAALNRVSEGLPMAPRNLDFEGDVNPASRTDTRDWIVSNSLAFATEDPSAPLSDLEPLRALIGNATLVGLGEATHGTREFQRMKHRMVEFLVKKMGFSHLGLEGQFLEWLEIDHYLQTGEGGDPSELLANLFQWPWNTDEMLGLINAMRAWNVAGQQPRVHVFGTEFMAPANGMDTVKAFVRRMDPAMGERVDSLYDCLDGLRFSADSPTLLFRYSGLPAATRIACRSALQGIDAILSTHEGLWGSREGGEKMRLVRRLHVLTLQWEEYAGLQNAGAQSQLRDRYMAENASWWHDVQVPGSKLMLWAHDLHVIRRPGQMGMHLSDKHGAAYLNVAFTFGLGSFNADITPIPVDDTLPRTRAMSVPGYREDAIEAVFNTIGMPRLIFDARAVRGPVTEATEPLLSPLAMRSIGHLFSPRSSISSFHQILQLARDYDLIVWFDRGSPTTLRPLPIIPP